MAETDTLATRLQRAMEYVPGPQWSLAFQAFICQVCNGKGGPAPHDVAHAADCLFAPLGHAASLSGPDLDAIEARAAAATRGPWRWFGNVKTRQVYLATTHSGRRFILQFWRWGTRDAQPVFQIDHRMVKLEEMVAQGVVRVDHNREIIGVNHPDALFIERAREDVDALLAEVRRLRTAPCVPEAEREDAGDDDGNDGDSNAITAFARAVKNDSPFAPVLGAGLLGRFQRLRRRIARAGSTDAPAKRDVPFSVTKAEASRGTEGRVDAR
jgi:hypothetical protein